jgi:cytochrome c oxidase assembly protein subunit 15
MTHHEETPLRLRRYAKFVAAATLLPIFAGAMVTSTGSGLAVPDWPLSYGMFFPPMVGGIFYEHGHRMIAAMIGSLIVIQALWLQLRERKRFVRLLGWTAVGAVIAQGLLGGLTVLFLLPPAISIGHAALAEICLCLNVSIAFFTSAFFTGLRRSDAVIRSSGETPASQAAAAVASPGGAAAASESGAAAASAAEGWAAREVSGVDAGERNPPYSGTSSSLVSHSTMIVALVYVQILLGALMRHLGAGLAIPDFPLSFGMIVPPIHSLPVAVNFAHRAGALFVTVAILLLGVPVSSLATAHPVRRLYQVLMALLGAQLTLGAYTVWSGKHPIVASFHLMTGALTLGTTLLLCLTVRSVALPDETPEQAILPQEVTA